MAAEPSSVTFETTVAVTGNNTGIVVPEEAIEQLAAGKRPPVLVNINGYEHQNTVGVMGGKHMVSISTAVRKATALQGGDPIHVTLTVTTRWRAGVGMIASCGCSERLDSQVRTHYAWE